MPQRQFSNQGQARPGGFPASLVAFVGSLVASHGSQAAFSWQPGGFSWRTKPKHNFLFIKKVSKVWNINHIQLNHHSPSIAAFHPSTRPTIMQANEGYFNNMLAAAPAEEVLMYTRLGRHEGRFPEWRQGGAGPVGRWKASLPAGPDRITASIG